MHDDIRIGADEFHLRRAHALEQRIVVLEPIVHVIDQPGADDVIRRVERHARIGPAGALGDFAEQRIVARRTEMVKRPLATLQDQRDGDIAGTDHRVVSV